MSIIKFSGISSIKIDDTILIKSENKLELVKLHDREGNYIYCLKEIKSAGEFHQFDGKFKKIKIPKKKNNLNIVTNKLFYDIPIEYWKPKNVVQYVRYKFKTVYSYIPLELDWNDSGYIANPRDRSKCWAHAKHLIDKFDKLNISRKRLKDYIDWAFEKFETKINMGFLSCNSWIDQYYSENKRKKISIGYEKTSQEVWNRIVAGK